MKSIPLITTRTVGSLQTNCYIVMDKRTHVCCIIDPGDDAEYISDKISSLGASPQCILLTHGHFDHMLAACALQLAYDIPVMIQEKDLFLVARMQKTGMHFLGLSQIDPPPQIASYLSEGQEILLGDTICEIVETPGHTPGSVSVYIRDAGVLFVGDTMFAGGGVGRTDHIYSNPQALRASIHKILQLPAYTVLYPGHGEQTRVGAERQ